MSERSCRYNRYLPQTQYAHIMYGFSCFYTAG